MTQRRLRWTVEFEVSESWVTDGFDLTADVAHEMLEHMLPWSRTGEIGARVVAVPNLHAMRVARAGLDIPESWFDKAGAQSYQPATPSYVCHEQSQIVMLSHIEPPTRAAGVDDFREETMVSILAAMASGDPLPPIDVISAKPLLHQVYNGFHRFYASRALGFTHIPALVVEPG